MNFSSIDSLPMVTTTTLQDYIITTSQLLSLPVSTTALPILVKTTTPTVLATVEAETSNIMS